MKTLTIGMATYDDYEGVYFSIQSLRMYHEICKTKDIEFVVIDNNPDSKQGKLVKKFIETSVKGKYIPYTDVVSSFTKYKVADYAEGKYVLIIDCHVLLENNGINNLLEYYRNTPNCKNLIQGPLLYDDMQNISTHFDETWRGHMWGVWANNKKAYNKGKPFEIPMQGMGLLSFEKEHCPDICKQFKGFGGEEGYIAEKFRQNGGKNICLPNLKWMHRFNRPNGVPFNCTIEDRIWNYFIGWMDVSKYHPMIKSTYDYFKNEISEEIVRKILYDAKKIYS